MSYVSAVDGDTTRYIPPSDNSDNTNTGQQNTAANGTTGSSSNPPPPPQTQGSVTYTVQNGETLGELSTRYGVSEQQILAANPQLRDPTQLGVGQQIAVPVMDNGGKLPTQIQVQPGQNLTQIGAQHGVSVSDLAAANGLTDPSSIPSGGHLWIPVQGSGTATNTTATPNSNPLQSQISGVDTAVKQYLSSGQTSGGSAPAQEQLTRAVENEIRARVQTELTNGQLPGKDLLDSYGASIASRYGNDPAIQSAIQQAVANQGAAYDVDAALKQVNAAQQALNVSGPTASQYLEQNLTTAQNNLTAKIQAEIRTRAGLSADQIPDAATVQKSGAIIAQRYTNDPTASQAVNQALSSAGTDFQVQSIVSAAQTQSDPIKALDQLNKAYSSASPAVQQALLNSGGAQAILKAAANQATSPLQQVSPGSSDFYAQIAVLRQSLQNLDQSASQLDPAVAAALVNQALPQIEQYNSQYAAQHGGQSLASDVLHTGPATIDTVMSLSGRLAGTAQGQQDIDRLAKLGFWDNTSVRNALATGASAAYPEAIARQMIAAGQDPTNVMGLIQEGVQLDQKRVQSDVQALGQHNAELAWLINNLGPSMTQAQLDAAIKTYESKNGWMDQNNKLTQQLITDGTTLTQNLKSLGALAQLDPQAAANLKVNDTISAAYNDQATSYGLTLAAGNNPGLYTDSKGQSFLNLLASLKLADTGRKSAQIVGSLVLRSMVINSLGDVRTGPNALSDARAALDAVKAKWAWKLLGVDDETAWNSAVDTVKANLPGPKDSFTVAESKLTAMNKELNQLKALGSDTTAGQLIRTIGVTYALANTINSGEKFAAALQDGDTADQWLSGAQALTAAAGLVQKSANLAKGLDLVKSPEWLRSATKWMAQDPVNGSLSIAGGVIDLVEGVRSFAGAGVPQDRPDGVFSGLGGLGGILYGASQFSGTKVGSAAFDTVAGALFDEVPGGAVAGTVGLVGVGLVAVAVIGKAIYQEWKDAHQYEGAANDFLQGGGAYSANAASALSSQDGLTSGSAGTSGVPFLEKYAQMKGLTTVQLQQWVNSLNPSQLSELDKSLLQTAGDSNGDVNQFTDGPPQTKAIGNEGGAAIITLTNTLGVFESNLKSSGVPLPP